MERAPAIRPVSIADVRLFGFTFSSPGSERNHKWGLSAPAFAGNIFSYGMFDGINTPPETFLPGHNPPVTCGDSPLYTRGPLQSERSQVETRNTEKPCFFIGLPAVRCAAPLCKGGSREAGGGLFLLAFPKWGKVANGNRLRFVSRMRM